MGGVKGFRVRNRVNEYQEGLRCVRTYMHKSMVEQSKEWGVIVHALQAAWLTCRAAKAYASSSVQSTSSVSTAHFACS